jgi:GTP cyclohydrolase I
LIGGAGAEVARVLEESPVCVPACCAGNPDRSSTMVTRRCCWADSRQDRDQQGRHQADPPPGIKVHPVKDKSGGVQHTIAELQHVRRPAHNFKGTHMSRFVEILNSHEREISVENFSSHAARDGRAPRGRDRPHRDELPLLHQQDGAGVRRAEPDGLRRDLHRRDLRGRPLPFTIKVVVPVTSLCPCSKKISERGAHNQRSHVTVTASINDHLWIEEWCSMVEAQASCELYGLLKRPDEKYVTERAYDNPKFVEDMVRDVAGRSTRAAHRRLRGRVENFESIHNHSAYALIENDKRAEHWRSIARKQTGAKSPDSAPVWLSSATQRFSAACGPAFP